MSERLRGAKSFLVKFVFSADIPKYTEVLTISFNAYSIC